VNRGQPQHGGFVAARRIALPCMNECRAEPLARTPLRAERSSSVAPWRIAHGVAAAQSGRKPLRNRVRRSMSCWLPSTRRDCRPRLTAADLAPLDQFHAPRFLRSDQGAGGARRHRRNEPRFSMSASGIGGPARYPGESVGCKVVGIDLTAEYCRLAEAADRAPRAWPATSSSARPTRSTCRFGDGEFDRVWTQHVARKHRRPAEALTGRWRAC